MATIKQPTNETPPICACGCGESVNWMPGKGWATYVAGHAARGKPGTLCVSDVFRFLKDCSSMGCAMGLWNLCPNLARSSTGGAIQSWGIC